MRLNPFHRRVPSRQGGAAVETIKEKTSPWKLGGLTPLQLGKRLYREFTEDEIFTRSAALSYYLFTALIPMTFFLVTVLGIFASQSEHLRTSLLSYFGSIMPPDAYSLLQKTLREISTNSSGFKLAFGLLVALWIGSGGMSSLMEALNRCYHVQDSRPYWKQKLVSIALTIAITALTVCALAIVFYGADIAQFAGARTGWSDFTVNLWRVAQWAVALGFVMSSFALIYFWAPDARQGWQWITPGSLIGVLAWIGASLLFRVYLHFYNSYSKTYGSLGAVIVLLLWLYISAMAILAGGEINSEIENAAARRGHPEAKEAGEKAA